MSDETSGLKDRVQKLDLDMKELTQYVFRQLGKIRQNEQTAFSMSFSINGIRCKVEKYLKETTDLLDSVKAKINEVQQQEASARYSSWSSGALLGSGVLNLLTVYAHPTAGVARVGSYAIGATAVASIGAAGVALTIEILNVAECRRILGELWELEKVLVGIQAPLTEFQKQMDLLQDDDGCSDDERVQKCEQICDSLTQWEIQLVR